MNWYDFLFMGGGISMIASGVWWIVVWKPKKKVEQAQADLASAEAESRSLDNLKSIIDIQADKIEKQETRLDRVEKESREMLDTIAQMKYALMDANTFRCTVHPCPNRKPPFGTYHKMEQE